MVDDALARLIEASPDDLENFRVYADHLEEVGDPRATLIRLQMTRARLTDRTKLDHLETRLAEYFEQHRADFLGPLSKVLPTPKSSKTARAIAPELEWRNGFIYKARLRQLARMKMHVFLDHLLAHPSGRFIVDLDGFGAEDPQALVGVLAARAPRSLRRLETGGSIDLSTVWPRLELLEELSITSVRRLGTIALPNLRRAHVDVSDPSTLESLATAQWPKLEHLRLRIWPETATAAQVAAVFENHLPSLRTVELGFDQPAPALLPMLSELPIGKQLTELTVRVSTAIVDALERCAFELDVLHIDEMYPDPRPRLQHLAKQITS